MRRSFVILRPGLSLLFVAVVAGCSTPPHEVDGLPPPPPEARAAAAASRDAARPFERHVWRDTEPMNADGTVTGVVEIPRGDSSKYEFQIPLNRFEVTRIIPPELGGYPVNYGFFPRTISYDGDPADVLVLGPPVATGEIVRGQVIALMGMLDSGEIDSKVVISPVDENGQPRYSFEFADRERLATFFSTYKQHRGKATRVTGWGSETDARAFLKLTAEVFAAGR